MPRAWIFTFGLAVLAVLGAALASRVEQDRTVTAAADPCFRYGRFECCVRPGE